MKGWKYQTNLSPILNNRRLPRELKITQINEALGTLPVFQTEEGKLALNEFNQRSSTEDGFEEALDMLFEFCDYYRVWLSA